MNTNLTVQLVNVTPELAENYLRFNSKNRKVSETQIDFLFNEMKNNRFLENGEAIIFDKYGNLKDGQHRLLSIIKSNKSYHIPVVRGVETNTMATYDTGKNRTAADVLSLNGFKNSSVVAPLIIQINKYCISKSKSRSGTSNRAGKLTNQQVLDYCSINYDWIKENNKKTISINNKQSLKVLSKTQIGLIIYIIGGEHPKNEVYKFLQEITGISRTPDTATNYLYTKLYNSKINKEPLNLYWILGMVIKSWNYYSDGNPSVKHFKFDMSKELPKANTIINI